MLPLGAITEEQFDRIFGLTFAVCCLPCKKHCRFWRPGVHILTGSTVSIKEQQALAFTARVRLPSGTLRVRGHWIFRGGAFG
jgi:hypothetical protein